jgi:lysophospholipid acyltransferase (LPLAT)-like uncharacterized protein
MNISWRNKLNGWGLRSISRLAYRTGRVSVTGWDRVEKVRAAGLPVLWGAWHGQSMMLIPFFHEYLSNYKLQIMMPDDWRGESLYYWTKSVGFYPYPMNLENKGMETARKFADLVKLIKTGEFDNYISPDGPHGPSHVVKPGLVYLAEKVGAPIVPIGAYSRSMYEVKRWDAYGLPLPFAHIEVVIGEPIPVPRKADRTAVTEQVTNALHRVIIEAKDRYYLRYEKESHS